MWPLIIMDRQEMYTLQVGLAFFRGQHMAYPNLLMAVECGSYYSSTGSVLAFPEVLRPRDSVDRPQRIEVFAIVEDMLDGCRQGCGRI